jgi:predicted dehydrogenase
MKVLQVGCGGISRNWLNVLTQRDDIEIIGLADLSEATAHELREEYQLTCEVYADFVQAIQLHKPDLVIDTTVPHAHHLVVTTALAYGCHVFGEKPISDRIDQAIEMVQASIQAKKSYTVMQNRRYVKQIRSFQELIARGKIGDLGFLTANFFVGARFGGFRETMNSPLILDMAIHTFDQARFISSTDPISVYCHEFNPKGSWFQGNASACCVFEMTEGVVFTYNGSWFGYGNNTSWEAEWRAIGSKGSAIWDGNSMPYYEIEKQNENQRKSFIAEVDRVTPESHWDGNEGHHGCIDEMLAALKEKRLAETNCTDNIKSLAMVMASIKSAEQGRKVYIREILETGI